jgi:RNA polymerase sigma-70 factor, ECF subfamily
MGSGSFMAREKAEDTMARLAAVPPEDDPERSVDLLRKAQAGDEQARNDLIARYLPRLERWASGRLPLSVRTMLDTGDIVQEAIINALSRLPTLEIRSEKTLEVYLKRAIRNRIIDVYRRPRRNREEVAEDLPAGGPSALDIAIGHEELERYERALESLSEPDAQLIVMRAELGMDYKAIAEELGKSPDAARMALARALKRLAVAMQRGG